MGTAFWMAGVPGNAAMVKVKAPSAMVLGVRRMGQVDITSQCHSHEENRKGHHKQRHAAIGEHRTGQHDGQDDLVGTQPRPKNLGNQTRHTSDKRSLLPQTALRQEV